MLNIVQNLWKTLWRSLWIALGKLSTFLTKIKSAFTILWRKFSFARILHGFLHRIYIQINSGQRARFPLLHRAYYYYY